MVKERLSPKEAADLIGKTQLTLSRWRKTGDGPPYIKVGMRYEYHRDLLLAWRNGDHTYVGEVEGGWPQLGGEADPAASIHGELPSADVVFKRISDWKERERWKRANDIITRKAFTKTGIMRFEDDCALYAPQWNDPTEEEVAAFIHSHELETKAVVLEIGLPWLVTFDGLGDEYRTMLGAKNLIGAALTQMFKDEKRWRERAELGCYEEDMPMKPPESVSGWLGG